MDNTKKIYTLSYDDLKSIAPKDGDSIEVYKVSDFLINGVKISGNVIQEGERELPKDKKLSSLLKKEINFYTKEKFFLQNTSFDFAILKRKNLRGADKIISFDIDEVLSGVKDIDLYDSDEILIFNKLEIGHNPYITVNGEIVLKAGKYQYYENMTLSDITKSIAFKRDNFYDNKDQYNFDENSTSDKILEIIKTKVYNLNKNYIKLQRFENDSLVTKILSLQKDGNFTIKPFDIIEYFDFYDTNPMHKVSISGEVYSPGEYFININTTISDLIKQSGGITKKAFLDNVEVVRYSIKHGQRDREIINLDLTSQKDLKFGLHDDDELIIRTIPKWSEKLFVEITGEVKFPGRYPIEKGETIENIIKRAGGFTQNSFLEGVVFTRKSVQELQIKELNRSLKELKQKATYLSASPKTSKTSADNGQTVISMIDRLEADVARYQPIGRVVMKMDGNLERFKSTPYNIELEDGDKIVVPKINQTVTVLGEVFNANTFIYDPSIDASEYIQKAGGLKDSAESENIYVVRASGETQKVSGGFFSITSKDMKPGDTIIVPVAIKLESNMDIAAAVMDITYKLAVTVASLSTVGAI